MASRKDQKEALRREREERQRAAKEAEQRRRLFGYGAAGGLVVVVVVVLVVLLAGGGGDGGGEASADVLPDGGSVPDQQTSDLNQAVKAAGCDLKRVKAKSRDHTSDDAERIPYETNPPAEGRHFAEASEDGAYDAAPPDSKLVHALEHGRVIVWFKPTLPKDARADLKAFFDDDSFQMLITPRRKMPYAVAATAWSAEPAPLGTGQLLGCKDYSEKTFDALRAFRDEHRSNGPEAVP